MLYLNVHQTSDAGKVEGDFSNSYTYVDLMVKKIPLKKNKKKKQKGKVHSGLYKQDANYSCDVSSLTSL